MRIFNRVVLNKTCLSQLLGVVWEKVVQWGLVSLLISIWALVYSCSGNKTAYESLLLEQKNSTPIFRVTDFLPEIEAGCDPYNPINTVGIRVWNYGAVPLYIKSIEAERIWFCRRSRRDEKDAVAIPIHCYYSLGKSLVIQTYQGKLSEAFVLDNNSIERLCNMAFINAAPVNGFYSFTQFSLVKIDYTTVYGKECVEYFKDGARIEGAEYARIKALEPPPDRKMFVLSTLKPETFLECLTKL